MCSILATLLKSLGASLKLMREAESVINSGTLTMETMNNSKEVLLCPSNTLAMKASVLVPPPGQFF